MMWKQKKVSIKELLLIVGGFIFLTGWLLAMGWFIFQELEFCQTPIVVNQQKFLPSNSSWTAEVRILFLGDLMFDRNIRVAAAKNTSNFIFEPLASFLAEPDLVVANLEGPITEAKSLSVGSVPGESRNFIFTFDPALAPLLAKFNIRLVNLGNNHILNFGQEGLESTRQFLKNADVDYFGEPLSSSSQNPPVTSIIKEVGGLKIGFVGYNQFIGLPAENASITREEIVKLKSQADLVIVCAHWGEEYLSEPNQVVKKLAREFISEGADLIIGSHSHVIGQAEEYQGKKIYYSLGNFIFDQWFSPEVMRGLAVEVKINLKDKSLSFNEVELCLQKNGQTAICLE